MLILKKMVVFSEDEYAAARSSTLNAHYTSPTVIRSIYDAVERMGFHSGNILEPSMGVGNFFGMLPDSMADSRLYGVELDSITGRIAKKLYPQADITVAGFETTDRRDFYDLAVGNVPFGQYKVNDKAYNKLGFSIHNYFFAKAMPSVVQAEQIFTIDKSRALKYLGHLTPEEMRRVDDAVRISLALNPMGSIQQIEPIRRSTAVYAPPEVVDGKPPVYPYTPIRSSFENAGSIEEMMLYTELQSAVHAMIQRLEYSFTFNPSLLTSPKRKQQVTEILEEAEKYIWRIKEEMRCA